MSEQRQLLQLYILSSHLAAEAAGRAQQKALTRPPGLQDGGYCSLKTGASSFCIIHCWELAVRHFVKDLSLRRRGLDEKLLIWFCYVLLQCLVFC